MPPKTTPYQFSNGLQYVHRDPPFLAKLKQNTEPPPEQQKFQRDNRDDDDDNYDELDGAQVVVLNEGRHLTEEQARTYLKNGGKDAKTDDADENQAIEEEPSDFDAKTDLQSPTDDAGRILFRKPKITHKKTKQDSMDELKEAISIVKKRKDFPEDKREFEENDKDGNTKHEEKVKRTKKTKTKKTAGGLSFDQVD